MNFLDLVDSEIQKALPPDCKRIASDKLLGREPVKIRYAFHTLSLQGKSKLVNILVLPPTLKLDGYLEDQLIKLQDYILSKDCLLVVVHKEDEENTLGDIGGFVEDRMAVNSNNLLWIRCIANKSFKTCVVYPHFEDLHTIIHDLWNGTLQYRGPLIGYQQVNLELMKDECWKCGKPMKTVTGIVLPNKQLNRWNNTDWSYYNQLVGLSQLSGNNAQAIHEVVENLRQNDRYITPVGDRYSNTVKTSYLAAACPHCDALRGDFHVNDYRMQYLHSLNSRLNGELQYHSVKLYISQEIINHLSEGYEGCDHTCGAGWER